MTLIPLSGVRPQLGQLTPLPHTSWPLLSSQAPVSIPCPTCIPTSLRCPLTRKNTGEAWPQLKVGPRKQSQRRLLVARWADAGVSLLLYVREVGAARE